MLFWSRQWHEQPPEPSSFSALSNRYGFSSSALMFVFSIAFFQMCCCCLSFEKLHRLSRGGGALLGHSLQLAVSHLFSHLFPWCPHKRRGGVLPPERVGGRSWPEAAHLESFSAGLGPAGPAPSGNCFPSSAPPSSHKIFSWFPWEVTLH